MRRDAGMQIAQGDAFGGGGVGQVFHPGGADIVDGEIGTVIFQDEHAQLGVDDVVISGHAVHLCERVKVSRRRVSIFELVGALGFFPVIHRREGLADCRPPSSPSCRSPSIRRSSPGRSRRSAPDGAFDAVAVGRLGQFGPVAAQARRTQGADARQVIRFGGACRAGSSGKARSSASFSAIRALISATLSATPGAPVSVFSCAQRLISRSMFWSSLRGNCSWTWVCS